MRKLLDNLGLKLAFILSWIFFRNKPAEVVFDEVYRHNIWRDKESVSGPGSNLRETAILRTQLPKLLKQYSIASILDLPCGDFNWMRMLDLDGITYIGGDIVEAIVIENQTKYHQKNVVFKKINLLEDKLPKVDLILCRDCLVHFSYKDIHRALEQIKNSGSTYLLTTTYPEKKNKDIVTGGWRPLNLNSAPFLLPKPEAIIPEGCKEINGSNNDKSLGLWSIYDW